MTRPRRKAIFVSAIDYESPIQIGDHHLARQFALDGWKIAFISKPLTPFHIFSKERESLSRRSSNHNSLGMHHKIGEGDIWSYVPYSLIMPRNLLFLRNRIIYRYWHRTIFPNMHRLLRRNGFEHVDLLYLRDPLQSYLLKQVHYRKSIYRIADNDSGFLTYNKFYSVVEAELSRQVDCVVYSAREIENQIHALRPKKAVYLPNGVDYAHFQKSDQSEPSFYQNIKRPIVVYVGSIDFWFDFDGINRLVKDLPHFSFVIIGPNEKFLDKFQPASNLYLLGPISLQILPRYLFNANVGLIPFNKEQFPTLVNSISPIKLLEYMACGLPVVSTKWKELVSINSPAILCDTYQDLRLTLEKIATSGQINKQILQEFAAKHDWKYRYDELLQMIDS